ncbi:MAG: VCBS repeat-containing protein [Geobacter sp.]|nr:VCBS repeat-containing protein [Geobacter sp.]
MPLTEPIRNGAAADRSGIIYIAGGDALGAPRYAVTAYNTDTGASSNLGNLQEPRINASAAIIGDSLYVIGGSSDAVLASIEEFDLNSNTSSIKATLPAPRQLSSAVALGDKIYIIGGLDAAGSPTTTCWEFDPAANTFAEKASMPVACTAKSSLAANGKIYVVGGLTSVGLPPYSWSSAILEYDPAANTWKQVGGLLTSRHSLMAAVVNDTLYTIGGSLAQMYSDPLNLAVNEAASLVSSEPDLVWETKAPLPVGINRGQSGMISGRIYLLGGLSSNGITDEVQMYDPLTNTWTPQPSLYQRVLGAGVATWGDSIYLAGGDPGTGSGVTNIVQLYHPADGIVRQIGTLVTPRFRMNATILNNKLYVVGGMGENAVLDTIEEFDLATNVSVMKTILPEPRTLAGVVAVGRKLYILGGTGNSAANTCLEYDPVANAFTPISPMPIPGDVRAAFHANGKIYVVGVMSNTNPPVDNSIQEYDLATNSWRIIGYIPTPRVAQIAEFAAGKAYVVGGDNWQDPPLTVNEVWSLPDSWYVGGVDAFSSVVRWPAAQHSPVLSGSYLNIGNKFYLVTGSDYDSNGIWAQLQECNQITGEPLYDPQLPYTPLWADLTGAEGRLISVYDFWPGGGFDMTPPLVVSSNPASGAVRVGTSKIISITFSEQIDSASVTSSSFSLSGPGGTVAGAVGVVNGSSAQFVPSENLELGSTYTAMVTSEVKDMSGNLLQETYSWSFTTIGVGEVSFSPAGIYGVGTNPRYISAADFNGDGNADLAVASYSYDQSQSINEVSIMLGNGDGTFAPAVNYSPIEEPYLVKTGDFNNDGKVDLVVSSYSAVAVMLGNGDGTFASPLICGSVGGSVTTGDFNGDGRLDLAVGNQYIYVYLGNGNGTFYFTGSFDAWWGGGGSLNTTDFNGDGKADLAAINNQGMAILLGNGNGTFQPLVNYSTLNWPSSLALGDFNNDGKIDVAVSASGISIFQGNGDGTFQPERAYQPYYTNRIITGDFNNDGNADLAAVGQYGDVVTIFQGNGDGTFKDLVSYTQKLFPCALTAADFNRDGKLDLAVVNEFSNNVSLWFNNTTTAANAVPSWVYVASANSTGTFGVSWGASATVGASYVVEESKDVSFATSTQVYSGSGTFVNLAGRTNGTYYYRVKAVMSGHPDSAWQSPPNGCTVTLPCKVPAWSYVATANSTGTFGVSWGASATAGASYILEESRDDAGFANPVQVYSGSGTFVNRQSPPVTATAPGNLRLTAARSACRAKLLPGPTWRLPTPPARTAYHGGPRPLPEPATSLKSPGMMRALPIQSRSTAAAAPSSI